MMTKAIVLGCGLVGATMARDLAADEDFDVAVADVNAENLKKLACDSKIETIQDDLSDPKRLRAVIEPFDIVIGGLPTRIGFRQQRRRLPHLRRRHPGHLLRVRQRVRVVSQQPFPVLPDSPR